MFPSSPDPCPGAPDPYDSFRDAQPDPPEDEPVEWWPVSDWRPEWEERDRG